MERYWRFIKDLQTVCNTIRLLVSWNRRSSGIHRSVGSNVGECPSDGPLQVTTNRPFQPCHGSPLTKKLSVSQRSPNCQWPVDFLGTSGELQPPSYSFTSNHYLPFLVHRLSASYVLPNRTQSPQAHPRKHELLPCGPTPNQKRKRKKDNKKQSTTSPPPSSSSTQAPSHSPTSIPQKSHYASLASWGRPPYHQPDTNHN